MFRVEIILNGRNVIRAMFANGIAARSGRRNQSPDADIVDNTRNVTATRFGRPSTAHICTYMFVLLTYLRLEVGT